MHNNYYASEKIDMASREGRTFIVQQKYRRKLNPMEDTYIVWRIEGYYVRAGFNPQEANLSVHGSQRLRIKRVKPAENIRLTSSLIK